MEIRLWGRSTDLSPQGIGVVVTSDLSTDELVALQIQLPKAEIVAVNASVRYCKQGRCGLEFMDLRQTQREAIQAACNKLRITGTQM